MSLILQCLLDSVLLGGLYSLMAVGLSKDDPSNIVQYFEETADKSGDTIKYDVRERRIQASGGDGGQVKIIIQPASNDPVPAPAPAPATPADGGPK